MFFLFGFGNTRSETKADCLSTIRKMRFCTFDLWSLGAGTFLHITQIGKVRDFSLFRSHVGSYILSHASTLSQNRGIMEHIAVQLRKQTAAAIIKKTLKRVERKSLISRYSKGAFLLVRATLFQCIILEGETKGQTAQVYLGHTTSTVINI